MPDHRVELQIPVPIESQNKRDSKHWAQRKRYRDRIEQLVRFAVSGVGRSKMPRLELVEGKIHVQVHRYGKGQLDVGNLAGGAKPLVDALTSQGLIRDDSPDWIELEHSQSIDRKRARTVVTLTWREAEAPPAPVETPKRPEVKVLKLEQVKGKVARVTAKEATRTKEGEPLIKARLKLEVTIPEDLIPRLPHVAMAVEGLLKNSRQIQEGSNSAAVRFKRDLPSSSYTILAEDESSVWFEGDVALTPEALVVEGTVQLDWTVDARLTEDAWSTLGPMLGEQVEITVEPGAVQGELELDVAEG